MEIMKNLSIMEASKLSHYHETQQQVVKFISLALNDVKSHFASEMLKNADLPPVYLVLGSERGFCGPYNEQLLEELTQQPDLEQAPLVGVGSRLAGPMKQRYSQAVCLPGAAVADEVSAVLVNVVETLNEIRQSHGAFQLKAIHFMPNSHKPLCQPVLPDSGNDDKHSLPPLINLPPKQLLGELLEHYLFAVTHAWFFAALMAENQRRSQHLEQAGHHLEEQLEDLGKRRNVLRQEEIIEEIEVILLSSELVGKPGG
jgi:F-type H+-transporting ATPase subunit gamma